MESVTVSVSMPGGAAYEVLVGLSENVSALREGVEKQREVPEGCLLKLFQDGKLLMDGVPLTGIDPTQPVFAVMARETKMEFLLQAIGNDSVYTDTVRAVAAQGIDPDTQTIELGAMPNIIDVLEEMGGKLEDLPDLKKGDDNTLQYSGRDGGLICPSMDALEMLRASGKDRFVSVCISIEVNSDSYNRGLGVVVEASPMMDSTVDDSGLPRYVYNGYGLAEGKKQNAVKFHPGMGGGAIRVEGSGGFGNHSMGFTPENWSKSEKKFHTLHVTLGADGTNQIRFQGAQEGQNWEKSWSHQLTAGRYIPAVYGFHDLGDGTLHIGRISMSVRLQ